MLQAVRWPPAFDSELALRAATYAKQIGRVVAFGLAAFRQAYAGGADLGDTDVVLIAASACEMHPRAVLQAIERDAVGGARRRRASVGRGDTRWRVAPRGRCVRAPTVWTTAGDLAGRGRRAGYGDGCRS